MILSISKNFRSGFEMWAVLIDSKLVGSFWTENAARTRMAELLKATHQLRTIAQRP